MRARLLPHLGFIALAAAYACDGALLFIPITGEAETTVSQGSAIEILLDDFGFGDLSSLDVTADEELANQGVQPGDISEVTFTLLELEATSPGDADLAFIDTLDVFVSSPGLPRVLVASYDAFESGVSTVQLDLEDVDIAEYVVSQSMTISTDASGNRPPDDTTVAIRYGLRVGVTSQGACNAISGDRDL